MLLKNNSNVCAQQILSILIAILIKFVTAFKNLMSYLNPECTIVWLANLCTSVILLLKKISNFQIIQCTLIENFVALLCAQWKACTD